MLVESVELWRNDATYPWTPEGKMKFLKEGQTVLKLIFQDPTTGMLVTYPAGSNTWGGGLPPLAAEVFEADHLELTIGEVPGGGRFYIAAPTGARLILTLPPEGGSFNLNLDTGLLEEAKVPWWIWATAGVATLGIGVLIIRALKK